MTDEQKPPEPLVPDLSSPWCPGAGAPCPTGQKVTCRVCGVTLAMAHDWNCVPRHLKKGRTPTP